MAHIELQKFFFPAPFGACNSADIIKELEPYFYMAKPPSVVAVASLEVKNEKAGVFGHTHLTPSTDETNKITHFPLTRKSLRGAEMPTQNFGVLKHNKWFEGKDTLFWAIFSKQLEIDMTKYFGKSPQIIQIEEKARIIEYIQKDTKAFQNAIKNRRITKACVQEILSKLLTSTINDATLIPAYAYYYGINIVITYQEKKLWCEIDAKGKRVFVEHVGTSKWRETDIQEIDDKTMVEIKYYLGENNIGVAMASVGNYKKEELIEIGKKLGIIECEKLNKGELYDKINIYCYSNR